MAVSVTGADEINEVFKTFRLSAANRIVRPAINKAGRRAAKLIKARIPGRYKGVRAGIGYRPIKYRNTSKQVAGKVGASVGKRKKKAPDKYRGDRKGVGFDDRNLHWWFLGTAERMTGTKRGRQGGKRGRGGRKGMAVRIDTGGVKRRTGKMPPQDGMPGETVETHKRELANIIRGELSVQIKKEILRIPRRRK